MYYVLHVKQQDAFSKQKGKALTVFCDLLQSKIHFTVLSTATPSRTFVVHVRLVKGLQSKAKHLLRHASAGADLTRANSGHSCNLVLWASLWPGDWDTSPGVNLCGFLHVAHHLPSPVARHLLSPACQYRQAV